MDAPSHYQDPDLPVLGPSPREIQIGLRWNIIAGMFAMVWLTLPGMPLTMLMECLGADALLVGLLVGIQQFAMVLQIPGALLGGLFRRRKRLWAVLSMVHRAVWFAPVLLVLSARFTGPAGIRLLLTMVTISSVFAQLAVSAWYAWMADLIPSNQRSRFWGTRQSLLWMVHTPSLLIFGYLLDVFPDPRQPDGHFFGFALVFGLCALAGCLDILIHLKVPEPPPVMSVVRRRLWQRIVTPFRNRDFKLLTVGMSAWYFNLGLTGSFAILYLSRKFGLSYSQLAVLNLSSSLAVIVGGMLWGYFIKRTGARSFLISMILIAPVFGVAWFFLRNTAVVFTLPWIGSVTVAQPVLVLLAGNFMAGLFYCGIGLCQLTMLSSLTPREDRTMAMAVHWTIIGLGSAFGPLLGGVLVDWFEVRFPMQGYPAGFHFGFMHLLVLIHTGVAWLVVLPLCMRLRVTAGELPLGATLSRLVVGNPLRLVGNIFMMDTASTSRSRERAVRGVGRQRIALAVSDLVEQLQNPTSSVREAAAEALGRIGNREAVAAIVAELGRARTGLTMSLLRSLQKAADPAALTAVLPWLSNPTPEIAQAAARTLGALRDRRAVEPLVELLATTHQDVVAAACAEALAAIGEPSAARPILARLSGVSDPVLTRTMAVTAADLFGNRDSFYGLIENEGRYPGTLTETLVDRLGDAVRALSRVGWAPDKRVDGLLRSSRQAAYAGDDGAALGYLRQLTRLIGAQLYDVSDENDADRQETEIACQNERFGTVLMFMRETQQVRETQQALKSNGEAEEESGAQPIGLPLALYLLAGLLQEEKWKRR